jgi:predicted porin
LSDKTVHNFGVKAPFGATTAFANYTVGTQTILGGTANQNKFDLRGVQAGVSYALSKRTDAYAIYGTQTMDNKATTIDMKDTGYAVGVRHTF